MGTRESLSLEWININDTTKDIEKSYILNLILINIKKMEKFKKYKNQINNQDPLFI